MKHFDYLIIGGGAAAFAAATKADALGVKTAMINKGLPLGGTCVNVGCVPSKHLLEIGKDLKNSQSPRFPSITPVKPKFNFSKAIKGKRSLVSGLRQKNYRDVLGSWKVVTLIEGRGKFISPHEVSVNGETLYGEKILIATGSSTQSLGVEGVEKVPFLTNVELLDLDRQPKSLVILGAGPIGVEFAQMYRRFGTQVTVIQRSSKILSKEEPEVSEVLQRYLEEEGIRFITGAKVLGLIQKGKQRGVKIEVKGEPRVILGDEILMATGLKGNTSDLDLDKAGVRPGKGSFIVVDDFQRTSVSHIWAAGDVAGEPWLETTAAKEGVLATENALEGKESTLDYESVPHAVFTSPEVASVGITESELMRRINVCSCRTVMLDRVPKALAANNTKGLVKMVVNPQTDKIVGVHIVAPLAADMIHEATLAVKFGLSVRDIIDTVHIFPTYSEAIKLAAQAYVRDISLMSCCVD